MSDNQFHRPAWEQRDAKTRFDNEMKNLTEHVRALDELAREERLEMRDTLERERSRRVRAERRADRWEASYDEVCKANREYAKKLDEMITQGKPA